MKEEKKICTLYVVRHGESEANVNKIVQGHTDSPLTQRGVEQAEEVAETFKDIGFDAIYSSDLERAKRTAQIIKLDRKIEIKTSPFLREKFFGVFEGNDHNKYVGALRKEFDRFDNRLSTEERWEHKAHPSIESDRDLLDRFMLYIKEIVSSHLGGKVLVVAHRYAIRMFLLYLGLGEHKDLKAGAFKTGGYAVLESDGSNFVIKEVVGGEKPKDS